MRIFSTTLRFGDSSRPQQRRLPSEDGSNGSTVSDSFLNTIPSSVASFPSYMPPLSPYPPMRTATSLPQPQFAVASTTSVPVVPPQRGLTAHQEDVEPEPQFLLGTWATRQTRLDQKGLPLPGTAVRAGERDKRQEPAEAADGQPGEANSINNGSEAGRCVSGEVDETMPGSLITRGLREQQAARQREAAAKVHGDDEVADAAWRWRFARRWHAEQVREVDPADETGDGDKTEEALQFLKAGGGNGWNMQVRVGRTTSSDMASLVNSLNRNGSLRGIDSELLSELTEEGLEEHMGKHAGGGTTRTPLMQPCMEATREMSALHKRAAELSMQQQLLEQQAQLRWHKAATGGEAWVAGSVPTVEIEEQGTFRFVILRIFESQSGRQRIVVHGRAGCSEAALTESAVAKVCFAVNCYESVYSFPSPLMPSSIKLSQSILIDCSIWVCFELAHLFLLQLSLHGSADSVTVLGGGIMEWSARGDGSVGDRHLRLHSAHSAADVGGGVPSRPSDLLNLASVLVRQSLPPTCHVTTG